MTETDSQKTEDIYWKLFLSFLKIGAFTFGGGWVMISIIEREIVDKYKWIERKDFLDLLAVAQALPGVLAVNMAAIVGDNLRGLRGSIVASVATIIPSFLIILAIAVFLTPEVIKNNPVVSSVFMGMRPAVVALIIVPVITSTRAAGLTWKTLWIPILTALMISLDIGIVSSPILYIVLGASGGYIYFKLTMKRIEEGKHKKE